MLNFFSKFTLLSPLMSNLLMFSVFQEYFVVDGYHDYDSIVYLPWILLVRMSCSNEVSIILMNKKFLFFVVKQKYKPVVRLIHMQHENLILHYFDKSFQMKYILDLMSSFHYSVETLSVAMGK
jgi:hypothetical protein